MKAWLFRNKECDLSTEDSPLELAEIPTPEPGPEEVLIKVSCCGVCHTELDEIEGRAKPSIFPVIPGHQVIGVIEKTGADTHLLHQGDRVGVAWINSSCGKCQYCLSGQENLCKDFKGTGKDANGGYAEYLTILESFAYPIPDFFTNEEAAPLLCAGAIGYRSLRLAKLVNGEALGLTGFGASGHLVLMLSKYLYPDSPVLVFARSREEQEFSKKLGAEWAGTVSDSTPFKASAIIDTTPVWSTIVGSLNHLAPGGRLIINAIRKEGIDKDSLLDMDYQKHLWMEKEIKSVANLTRQDVAEFLEIAAKMQMRPEVELYPFEQANQALVDMKRKHAKGAKVLTLI